MENDEQEFGLIEIDIKNALSNITNHDEMINVVVKNLPEIQKASTSFFKTQSQYMDNVLTVSHPTPLRNIRQILAEINRSKAALQEAYYNNKKKVIEIKILDRDIKKQKKKLEKELLMVDMEQKIASLESSKVYISGAIRKITNYIVQYKSILSSLNVTSFDELDFEKEEEEYHIKKSFDQAITAARSRNGTVDEGNNIYFNQIGINGAVAQVEIIRFLQTEGEMIKKGEEPSHKMITDFLDKMYKKFKGCTIKILKHKNMIERSDVALLIDHKLHVDEKVEHNSNEQEKPSGSSEPSEPSGPILDGDFGTIK